MSGPVADLDSSIGNGRSSGMGQVLAEVLIADVLAGDARCPACMGAAPCGVGVAHCRSCGDVGRRGGTEQAAETLVRTLIS